MVTALHTGAVVATTMTFSKPASRHLRTLARRIGLPCLDLKGNAFTPALNHKVDGLAAAHRVLLGHLVAAGPQVVGQPLLPVPVLRPAQPVRIGFIDAQCRFPESGQRQYFDS